MDSKKDLSCIETLNEQKGKEPVELTSKASKTFKNVENELNYLSEKLNLKYYSFKESLEHVLNIDFFLS